MTYYSEHSPESIAKAILSIEDCRGWESQKLLEKLNDTFTLNVHKMLKSL